jgi:hypothetical protein
MHSVISWLIWRHRNAGVFDGILPSVDEVLRQIRDEYQIWGLAGAKKLLDLKLQGGGAYDCGLGCLSCIGVMGNSLDDHVNLLMYGPGKSS